MARGTALSVLVSMLKAEIGDYSGTNTASDSALKVLLSNFQLWLATDMDWTFLERRWDKTVNINQQYVNLPTNDDNGDPFNINFEKMPKVEVFWTQVYQPVEYGIGADEYNTMNFGLNQQSDPIQRWRMATNPNEPSQPNAFEVWPVPVTQQVIRFTGQRMPKPLVNDTDTADLDDILLVMGVAAEKLMRSNQKDSQLKLTKYTQRLQSVRSAYPTRDKIRVLGGGGESEFKRERKLAGMIIVVK